MPQVPRVSCLFAVFRLCFYMAQEAGEKQSSFYFVFRTYTQSVSHALKTKLKWDTFFVTNSVC